MVLFKDFTCVLDALIFHSNAISLFIYDSGHLLQIFPDWKSLFFEITDRDNVRSLRQTPEVLYKKAVLKNFAIFTGKNLCWSLYLNEICKKTYFEEYLWTAASAETPVTSSIH